MIFFNHKTPKIELHDLISDQVDPDVERKIREKRARDPVLEAEISRFEEIRKALKGLPNLSAPRSFRMTPQMAGVKPPVSRSLGLVSRLAGVASLIFVLSFGASFANNTFMNPQTEFAIVAEPMSMDAPMSVPEAATMAEAPLEESVPEDLMLKSAPMEVPSDDSSRNAMDEVILQELALEETGMDGYSVATVIIEMVGWISLGVTIILFVWMTLGRIIQLRAWTRKWKK